MSKFMDEKYMFLEEYVPGEQPTDMQYIKLNTNESPFPPSPIVSQAITKREIDRMQLYPDPECGAISRRLGDIYGFDRENIFIGNGSDDILNFAFMAFCQNGAAFPDITYGFYEVFAKLHGIKADIIPLKDDFSIDPADYEGIGKTVFIANPNAPTGLILPVEDIERIAVSNPDNVVVVDEAYIDFGGKSCVDLVRKYDNVLVVRTYSKSRSLAGGRLGFSIGSKEITADLMKIKFSTNPYSVNRLTLLAGEASLLDQNYYKENCAKIIMNRRFTKRELDKMGFETIPSLTNFLFTKHPAVSGETLYEKLKENGILVRHFNKDRIKDYIRVTIGTYEQMKAFVSELRYILEREEKSR